MKNLKEYLVSISSWREPRKLLVTQDGEPGNVFRGGTVLLQVVRDKNCLGCLRREEEVKNTLLKDGPLHGWVPQGESIYVAFEVPQEGKGITSYLLQILGASVTIIR